MRRLLPLLALLAATALIAEEPLTNAEVLRLHQAGVPASVIVNKISTSSHRFDLSTEAIIGLTKAGVPEVVINAMLTRAKTTDGSAQQAAANEPAGPDLLRWKQECTKIGWPDYICLPEQPAIQFVKVHFYRQGARTPGAGGELRVTRDRITATTLGGTIFDLPWTEVESFCTEFAYRNMVYLHTTNGEWKFDLGGHEDRLSTYLKRILTSIRPEKCSD